MSLKKYLAEAQETIDSKIDSPVIGDNFAIELKEGCLFESHVVAVEGDIVVLEADEASVKFFAEQGIPLDETVVEENVEYCDACDHAKEQCVCETVEESKMSELDIERQDWENLSPLAFYNRYKISKDAWYLKYASLLSEEELAYHRIMELAGTPAPLPVKQQNIEVPNPDPDDITESKDVVINGKPVDLKSLEVDDVDMSDYPDFSDAYISYAEFTDGTPLSDDELDALQDQHGELAQELAMDRGLNAGDAAYDAWKERDLDEAEYQGRKVPLGKPMRGDVKKFKVYVRKPNGKVVKVNFGHGGTTAKRLGQKTMRIKKSNPARRKSFRARHNCANPGPRWKARYWSCRAW